MKNDLLEYMEFLKNKDLFLYKNYKTFNLFFESLIRNDSLLSIFSDLDGKCNSKFDYSIYDDKDILNYVYSFFNKINSDLANIFYDNVESGKLIYNNDVLKPHFKTFRDNDTLRLNNYIIEIPRTNTVKDFYCLVHEFTHYLINRINEDRSISKSVINIYDEAIAIYSELLFFDFIKNKISLDDSKRIIEERLYNCFVQGSDLYSSYNAIELICDGKSYDEVVSFLNDDVFLDDFKDKVKNKKVFPYEHFIGTISALKMYFDKVNLSDLISLINDGDIDKLSEVIGISFNTDSACSLFINYVNDMKVGGKND
jgi:hypothetical protein